MNTPLPHDQRQGNAFVGLIICLCFIAVIGGAGYVVLNQSGTSVDPDALITQVAKRGPFDHVVLEQGEVESSSNTEIVCEVKSRGSGGTAILWVIEEGTKVKEGEKLIELDSAELELNLKEQKNPSHYGRSHDLQRLRRTSSRRKFRGRNISRAFI